MTATLTPTHSTVHPAHDDHDPRFDMDLADEVEVREGPAAECSWRWWSCGTLLAETQLIDGLCPAHAERTIWDGTGPFTLDDDDAEHAAYLADLHAEQAAELWHESRFDR